MTVKELVIKLISLPIEQQELTVCFTDEVWVKEIEDIELCNEDTYGVTKNVKLPFIHLTIK